MKLTKDISPNRAILEGRLAIFHYVPNLRIVGGYHSLNERDKDTLGELISESDFVAVEYDELRGEGRNLSIRYDPQNKGYDHQNGNLNLDSRVDQFYLSLFWKLNNKSIRRGNRNSDRNDVQYKNSELRFSLDTAREMDKTVHLVDQPIYMTFQKLTQLSLFYKMFHLLSLTRFPLVPIRVDEIMHGEREQYMLRKIEEEEGALSQLKRKGILVVGMKHAKNFFKYSCWHGF